MMTGMRRMDVLVVLLAVVAGAHAGMAGGHHGGGSMGRHGGRGGGRAGEPGPWEFMQTIHELLWNREEITRSFNKTATGIESRTHSTNPTIAAAIRKHVAQMQYAVENDIAFHLFDPLFVAVFDHAKELKLTATNISTGVVAHETGSTPCAVALVQEHAKVVSSFIAEGREAVMSKHKVPAICGDRK
jgi:hypothetical protein